MSDLIKSSQTPCSRSGAPNNSFENLKNLFCFSSLFHHTKQQQKTLADKMMEPAQVKSITRLYTSPEDAFEEEVIDMFLHFYYALPEGMLPQPQTNTFAMAGRPLFAQINMSNGLAFLSAISEVGEINWFKSKDGQVSGFNPMEHSATEIKRLAESKSIIPAADLNRHYYKVLLYPYHEDGKIRKDDFLDLGLKQDAPLDSKTPVDLSGHIWLNHDASFKKFNQFIEVDGEKVPKGVLYPPHLLKLLKKLEAFYETQKHTLGDMIYTLFSSKKGGSCTALYSDRPDQTEYFCGTDIINPNRRKKIASPFSCTPALPLGYEKGRSH